MAQYGGGHEQHVKEGQHIDEHGKNPVHLTTGVTGTETGYAHQQEKHAGTGPGTGGILHRSGSGSSSSSEDDGEGGRRKKKGVVEKIKEKLPGGGHEQTIPAATAVGGGGYEGVEGHEKKGIMEQIKEKLPGGHTN